VSVTVLITLFITVFVTVFISVFITVFITPLLRQMNPLHFHVIENVRFDLFLFSLKDSVSYCGMRCTVS
jgi:hypothetical protein